MAEDKENEAAKPPASAESKGELPVVESPPLSPAGEVVPLPEPKVEPTIAPEPEEKSSAPPAPWRLRMKARQKRQALLAASVALAAGIGAIIGALAVGGPSAPPPDSSGLRERQAMQQSIGKLNGEIAALKTSIEAGNKSARSQIAKINDKITERISHPPETTGSIPLPPAVIPSPAPRPPMRPEVVRDWSIHDVRDGYVYVKGHGDIYQVVPGAPLPGLGPVREIKRQDGRWVVVTPKGLIVSMRDRRYFDAN